MEALDEAPPALRKPDLPIRPRPPDLRKTKDPAKKRAKLDAYDVANTPRIPSESKTIKALRARLLPSARQSAHGWHATHARHHAIVPRENVAPPTCQRVAAIATRIRPRGSTILHRDGRQRFQRSLPHVSCL